MLNALIEGSQSYGVSSKYFKEIVDDINLGTPIEKALDNAVKYSPSEKFRKILFQINTALKVGIDVAIPLNNVIEEITEEQLTEIRRYGKKTQLPCIVLHAPRYCDAFCWYGNLRQQW